MNGQRVKLLKYAAKMMNQPYQAVKLLFSKLPKEKQDQLIAKARKGLQMYGK